MSEATQLTLFDVSLPRVKRFRRSSADKAQRRARGRLVVAGGLVADKRGRLLLLHRSTPKLTWWETPGGKVDRGEGPRSAAIREFGEELGVEVSVVQDLGWHDLHSCGRPIRYALYLMRIDNGTPCPIEEKLFDDLRWFSWLEILEMRHQLSPNANNVVDLFLAGRLSLDDFA